MREHIRNVLFPKCLLQDEISGRDGFTNPHVAEFDAFYSTNAPQRESRLDLGIGNDA